MVEPIVKRAGGLDVHKKSVVACLVVEQEDGRLLQETRTFGTTGEQRRALCAWLKETRIELVVMERTDIYWKSVYAALEQAGAQELRRQRPPGETGTRAQDRCQR